MLVDRLRARNVRCTGSASFRPRRADRTVTAMHPSPAVAHLAATSTTATAPPGLEVVPVHPNANDPSWPPVLIVCVAVVVLGGLVAALIFLRRAWRAAHPARRPLDG
jgi:hypothetical protein